MSILDAISMGEKLGFPAVFLIFLFICFYKVGKYIGTRLDPFLDQIHDLVQGHHDLMKDLKTHIKRNDDLLHNQISSTQEQLNVLTEKLTLLTDLAIERNNRIKDTTALYEYIDKEISPKTHPNIFDL